MSQPSPTIRSAASHIDSKTFRHFTEGNKNPNVWTIHIRNVDDLLSGMVFLRNNMDVSFGLGPNDTLYIIDDSSPGEAEMEFFNMPLSISYNEYTNEVSIVEYFSDQKYDILNSLVKEVLIERDKDSEDAPKSVFDVNLALLGMSEEFRPKENPLLDHIANSEAPFAELSEWLKTNSRFEYPDQYQICERIWWSVMRSYIPPTQFYPFGNSFNK